MKRWQNDSKRVKVTAEWRRYMTNLSNNVGNLWQYSASLSMTEWQAADHVSGLLTSCSRLLYALRVLRSHGITATSMSDIFRSTVLAKLLYCAPAWSGFCSAADRVRLEAFLRRCQRLGYCSSATPTLAIWPRCSMRLMSHCSLASWPTETTYFNHTYPTDRAHNITCEKALTTKNWLQRLRN